MDHRMLVATLLLGLAATQEEAVAQRPVWGSTTYYTLLKGSQLTDDCPICDRIPIILPMSGTFGLHLLEENPLYSRYEVSGIAFHAGTNVGQEYWANGRGTWQFGGEVAITQEMFLDLGISNGVATTRALCASTNPTVSQPWPAIQIDLSQTNGTEAQVYYLNLVAAPALQFRSITPDMRTGNLRLEWEGQTGQVQVERASSAEGPYFPLSPLPSGTSFVDPGALTNELRYFYRLRQK
jgi:hypothetical protein